MNEKMYTVHDIVAAEYNLQPLVCLFCGSRECAWHEGVGDARCADCGKWQLGELEDKQKAYKIWLEIEEYDPVTDTHADVDFDVDFIGYFGSFEEAKLAVRELCLHAKSIGLEESVTYGN